MTGPSLESHVMSHKVRQTFEPWHVLQRKMCWFPGIPRSSVLSGDDVLGTMVSE